MKKYLDLDSDMERTLLARQYLNSNERTDRKSRSVLALFVSLFLVAFFLFFIKDRAEASEKKTAFLLTAEEEEKLSLLSEREILIGYAADSEYSVTGDGLEYGLLVPVKEFLENELDFQVEMVRQGEDRIIEGLMTGETDLAFISETKKEQSGELCSVPVYENTLFYLSNQRGKEMEAGQVIGFLGSCREEKTVRESINSSCTAVPYKDGAALAEAVEKGIVDGAVVGKVTALDLCVREGIWPKPLPQSDSMVLVSRDGRMKEVLSILDRCLLQTEEGEIFEERFFQEERNYLKFCLAKVSQGTLKKLQEKYSRILYYAGEGGDYPFYYEENGEKKGQLLRLLDFFEEASGILMEELPSHGEAEELLEEGKIQLLVTTDSFFEERKMVYLSTPLCKEKLICIAGRETKGDEDYWGITEENRKYLKTGRYAASIKDGRGLLSGSRIAYATGKELMQALKDGKIHQAVMKEGEADYLSLYAKEAPFWYREGNVLEVSVHFAAPSEHRDLILMMNEVIRLSPFWDVEAGGSDVRKLFEEERNENRQELSVKTVLLWISMAFMVLLSGVILILCLRREQPLFIIRKGASGKEKGKEGKKEKEKKDKLQSAESVKKEGIVIEEAVKKERLSKDLDVLTGLYNRNIFQAKICEIVERSPEALGVFAFIDMDRLKKINLHFGRKTGDEILLKLAQQLQGLTEGEDRVAFRMGGDDFGIFCGNLKGQEEVRQFCHSLRDLTLQVNAEGERIMANFSIGVSIFNQDAYSLLELMECADEAMSCCKENGLKMSFYRKKS